MQRRGTIFVAPFAEGGFSAYWDAEDGQSRPEFLEQGPVRCEVEEAIAWGRERSDRVVVRLGQTDDTVYSAGSERLTDHTDNLVPLWPPANGEFSGTNDSRRPRT
jgi:hypothetical protein